MDSKCTIALTVPSRLDWKVHKMCTFYSINIMI